jgi:hypothetical protein
MASGWPRISDFHDTLWDFVTTHPHIFDPIRSLTQIVEAHALPSGQDNVSTEHHVRLAVTGA